MEKENARLKRLLAERMHQHSPNSDSFGGIYYPARSILEERATESAALMRACDGKASKHNHGNRVRHVPPKAPGSRRRRHRAGCKRVIAHNLIAIAEHVRAGCAAHLVGSSAALQPVVQAGHPAVERRNLVMIGLRLRRRKHHSFAQGGVARMVRRSRALGRAGASRRLTNSA